MRLRGRLAEWNDERGFGFITPLDGEGRVFVHVSAFPADKRRPIVMDLVTYALGRDDRGRQRAIEVLFMAPTAPAQAVSAPPRRPLSLPIPLAIAVLLLAVLAFAGLSAMTAQVDHPRAVPRAASASDQALDAAFKNQQSGVQVTGSGVVTRVLSDDNEGSRHQRFILRLASGQTLLFAHNIDIAPRLASLAPGDAVEFSGVYEWNSEGGVVHWTHRDPSGQHEAGWLRHNGVTSQ
jgi:cold shock CspA family protein